MSSIQQWFQVFFWPSPISYLTLLSILPSYCLVPLCLSYLLLVLSQRLGGGSDGNSTRTKQVHNTYLN